VQALFAVGNWRVNAALAILACACRGNEPIQAVPPVLEISHVASFLLPRSTEVDSIKVGGISALAHEREGDVWLALSDAHVPSRLYELDVSSGAGGLTVTPRRAVVLQEADRQDTEGVARVPWGSLLVSTEGDAERDPYTQPKLLEFDRAGALLRDFEIPEKFLVAGKPQDRGIRDNLGFESLTISPDGKRVFVAAEGTLVQDGPVAGVGSAGFSRVIVYDVEGEELSEAREYVYPLGPFAPVPEFQEQEVSGGLVELVSLGGDRLLALERLFIREISGEKRDRNQARIFHVDLSSATDVKLVESLGASADWRPVIKELVLDLDDVLHELSTEYPRLDNLEAMGLGPELPGGGRALLLASDDNFQDKQRTQFLLFRLKGV
jgi:hypothetical protein